MNNETRKIFTLLLTVFIIVSAFIPALNPLPTINKATSEYSLFETFTNTLNSSNSTPISRVFNKLGNDFMSNYASDYLTFLDRILFGALGVLLVMLLIGAIRTIVSKKSGGSFTRVVAVLNTLTYAGLIILTFYQANKLNHDSHSISSYFIKITPSIGAWIGLITSFVLIIISAYGRSKTEATQFPNNQGAMFPHQNAYPQNSYTQSVPPVNVQHQPQFVAQSENKVHTPTRPDDANSLEEMEISRLGNGYVSNVFGAGASKSTGVTLTDKRLYLSGKLFKGKFGKKLKKATFTCTVDLQDIIGMEFKRQKITSILIKAIILFVFDLLLFLGILSAAGGINAFGLLLIMMFFIASIGIFIAYFSTGVTLFIVNTRNGSIGFDVSFAGRATVESFAGSIQSVKNTYNSQLRM